MRLRRLSILAVTLFGIFGAAPLQAGPAEQAAGDPAYKYEHIDTWENQPWELTPGRYGNPADISSAGGSSGSVPAGETYVLDAEHKAIHRLDAQGQAFGVCALPPKPMAPTPQDDQVATWFPSRLDVGYDDQLYVLSVGRYIDVETNAFMTRHRVDRLDGDCQQLHSFTWDPADFPEPRQGNYFDIAQAPDGRLYLSRSAVNAFIIFQGCDPVEGETDIVDAGVDVFSQTGDYLDTIDFYNHESVPWRLDVDDQGWPHVINVIPAVLANPYCGPQPTEPPSLLDQAPDQVDPGDDQWPAGVAIFDPNHDLQEIVEFFNAEEIAVGPAGVFISRNVEIYQLRDNVPMYVGPLGPVYAAYFNRIIFNLDVPVGGSVQASMHHCIWQGVMRFDRPSARPDEPKLSGSTDAPWLEGPGYPDRIAADERLAVLLGRYTVGGSTDNRVYQAVSTLLLPQTIQFWDRYTQAPLDGSSPLDLQMGVCAGGRTWFTRDLAMDQGAVYALNFAEVSRRPDPFLPAWRAYPGIMEDPDQVSRLAAVAAEDGKVAVLDEGTSKVHILSADGQSLAAWHVGDDIKAVPVDIALHGDRVYLADIGRNRIEVRDLDGNDRGSWQTHDGPESIAAGPDGDIYVLGRGRWGYRYSPTGRLMASWPMPNRSLWATDIDVDQDGKVYVSWMDRQDVEPNPGQAGPSTLLFRILSSGIWIFEGSPYIPEPAEPPPPQACTANPDKWAEPYRIPLGDTVDVTLTVNGHCPGRYEPAEIAIVVDTSRSMGQDDGLQRSQDALAAVLRRLDPVNSRAALITFNSGATLMEPLTNDFQALAQMVAALVPEEDNGDTLSTSGISVATRELIDNGRADVNKVLILVTDGALKDDPTQDAQTARDNGIDLYALITPTREFRATHRQLLDGIVSSPAHLYIDPSGTEITDLVDGLTRYSPESGLFQTITIVDEIPDNMTYIQDSASPAATYDPAAHSLTWTFGVTPASQTLRMTYTLRPEQVGVWPTNVQATASYLDAVGSQGGLIFPIPEVEVWEPETFRVYLPILGLFKCFPTDRPLDIVLIMDASTSMREDAVGGGTKLEAAQAAAGLFLDNLVFGPLRDQVAIVSFNSGSQIMTGLTDDRAALTAGLDAIVTDFGTSIDKGLARASEALDGSTRADAKPVIILLTDGIHNGSPERDVRDQAQALKDRGALIYTIGLGQNIQRDLLSDVATRPAGFFESPTSQELADIYAQIVEQLPCDTAGGG